MSNVLIVNTMPEKNLQLTVMDKTNVEVAHKELPNVKDKDHSGWQILRGIQSAYGFGDKCLVFDSADAFEEYKQHVIEAEEREQRTRKRAMGGR